MEVPSDAQKIADEKNFEIKMFRIGASSEQLRPPRLVRVAVIQNSIVRPSTDPVKEQVKLILWHTLCSTLPCSEDINKKKIHSE